MTETEQRIKFVQAFAETKTKDRRERIRKEVAIAMDELRRGKSDRYDMLCWGAAVILRENATQEQRDTKADLIQALKEAKDAEV